MDSTKTKTLSHFVFSIRRSKIQHVYCLYVCEPGALTLNFQPTTIKPNQPTIDQHNVSPLLHLPFSTLNATQFSTLSEKINISSLSFFHELGKMLPGFGLPAPSFTTNQTYFGVFVAKLVLLIVCHGGSFKRHLRLETVTKMQRILQSLSSWSQISNSSEANPEAQQ